MKIRGYHIAPDGDSFVAVNNLGDESRTDLLDFILKDTKGAIGVFYHMDYSVAQLLRYLQVDDASLRKFYENGKLHIAPWTLEYIPKKFFSITYGGGRYTPFTNLSDMYQWHHNSDCTNRDAVDYAKVAAEIGEEVYGTMLDIGLNPKSLVSPVNTFGKDVLSTLDLPTVVDIPDEAGEYAYKCLQGSWVEAFKKGYFKEAYDYDIKGAYSSYLAELLDTRFGEWRESKEYIDDAYYGYCYCWVNVHKDFSPVQFGKGEDNNFTPTGGFYRYLSKAYIDFIEEFDIGTCEIINGHWWIPTGSELVYPLEELIIDLNNKKELAQTKLQRAVVKRIPNGIWGKLIEQRKDDMCYNFMPPWAAEVENRCTLAVARFVLENDLYPDGLLHIAVDGVLTDRPVEVSGDSMGDWQLSSKGGAIVLGSGMCALEGKSGDGDFTLNYDRLIEMIGTEPLSNTYEMEKLSPVTLMDAVRNGGTDKLGKHKFIKKVIDVGYELKRNYPVVPVNGKQLVSGQYNSLPWGISVVQGMPDADSKAEDYR